jgi:malonyl-CoA/methylmalonyl-CoA synthetase
MTLIDLFAESFTQRRDEPALEWAGETLTFGDIDRRANRMARELIARGFGAGDRIAVYLPNGPTVIDVYVACTRLGIVYVPVNVLYREREIDHIVGDAGPRAVVAAGPVPSQAAFDVIRSEDLAASAAARDGSALEGACLVRNAGATAALVYTSGTTGPAKGAMLTQANLAANARALCEAWRFGSGDRLLLALPLFHVHGLGNGLHCWLASGCRMRLLERFDHATAAREFLDFRPTVFFGVPAMYVRLLEVDAAAARDIGRVARLFVSGSAPLPVAVFEAFRHKFGHAILERYGMTETLMTIGNPYDGERRPGSVGLPLPGTVASVRDEAGREVPRDVTGELHVRGATVFAGYWRRADATAAAFTDDGFFRTGDLASRAADGYITLRGRRSDMIISGGFNIYPREIEDLLLEHPAVAEAAVVGVPDEVRGEVPVAYVVPRLDAAPADIATLGEVCRASLASFKVPRAFVPVDRLPRTALGKVQKHLLPPWTGSSRSE